MTWLLADDGSEIINMKGLANAGVYTLFGVVVFALAFLILAKLMPFSIRKEIEEDQNTSLGIIIGALIIGLALIISAAVHG